MDKINAILDKYETKKTAETEAAEKYQQDEKLRVDAFYTMTDKLFTEIIIPFLKEAVQNLQQRNYRCAVDEHLCDDSSFHYCSAALSMLNDDHDEGDTPKSILSFASKPEEECFRVSFLIKKGNIQHCKVKPADIDQAKVEEKVALFLSRYLAE